MPLIGRFPKRKRPFSWSFIEPFPQFVPADAGTQALLSTTEYPPHVSLRGFENGARELGSRLRGNERTIAPPYSLFFSMSTRLPELELVVSEIADEMRARTDRGEVATYIPELACADPNSFGLAVIDADGQVACGGDSETPFSIQSISKVFTLTLALGRYGNLLWNRVGREPSGSAFNSIVQLELVVSTDRRNTLSYREKMECENGTGISPRIYDGREDRVMGPLAAWGVAQGDWAGFW